MIGQSGNAAQMHSIFASMPMKSIRSVILQRVENPIDVIEKRKKDNIFGNYIEILYMKHINNVYSTYVNNDTASIIHLLTYFYSPLFDYFASFQIFELKVVLGVPRILYNG